MFIGKRITVTVALAGLTCVAGAFASVPVQASGPEAVSTSNNARQAVLSVVAEEILRLTGRGAATGYAGYADMEISLPENLLTVYWKDALPAGLRSLIHQESRRIAINVVAAPYTWAALEAQTHRISAMKGDFQTNGVTLSRVRPLPGATGVEVGVVAGPSAAVDRAHIVAARTALAAADLSATGPAPTTVVALPAATTTGSRELDSSPWWGGARIVRSGQVVCSTGFSLTNAAGARFMLTAGHCGGIGTIWRAGLNQVSGPVVGTETNRDTGGDTAVIGVGNNQGLIYDKGWNSTVGEHITASASAIRGESLCTEGASSGVRCDAVVQATGIDLPLGNGEVAHNEVYATGKNGQQISAGGDSGGPVIGNTGTPGNVIAYGTITAGTGANEVNCTNTDPNVVQQCFRDVYFEDLNAALNHWRANLVFS